MRAEIVAVGETPEKPKRAVESPAGRLAALGAGRTSGAGDRVFAAIEFAFAGLILVIMAVMVVTLVVQAWPSITQFGLGFLTSSTWDPIRNIYGAEPAILGTIYSSAIALVLAAPVGILSAIFLVEFAPRAIRFPLGFLVELLAAVPSIVYGLWALFVLVPIVRVDIETPLIDRFGNLPLFSGYPLGLGMLSAGLILAIMILPTIAALSRDVLRTVPRSQSEAMLALGATRWQTMWKVVVAYARSGISGAIILALGRAVGETMAVQMVIGSSSHSITWSLFNPATTMPATIVNQFSEATGVLYRSALFEIALILMIITLGLNGLARILVWSVQRRGAA
ncbi:MAG TPA: phosphate ABC transporter permease subunit PstC [Chloroflexota bacterium]|nr:phosphate ABC transporter permease subunit PstC [Chloroflexota bacterium]